MLKIPYITAPKNACALACYTMVAKYYFPEITFDDIAKISDWKKDYVVWPYKFWLWILNKRIKIINYDLIDYQAWAKKGEIGLKQSLPKKEFNWIKANSTDLNKLADQIQKLFKHPNFTYYQKKPTFNDLTKSFENKNVCEVVLNSRTLDKKDGLALHRVVITDINKKLVSLHDPREIPRPNRKIPINHFKKSWLETLDAPELCVYSKTSLD